MPVADHLIRPDAPPDAGAVLGLVDLVAWPADAPMPVAPFPLIGLGDPADPRAMSLDAVVEPPVSAEALVRQIHRAPRAAAALVLLLRASEGVAPAAALTLESQAYAMLQGSAEHARWAAAPRPAPRPPGTLRAVRDGDSLILTIDRPWALNAIDRPLRDALHEAFALAALDPTIARVRLAAAGPAFSIGGDLAEFGTTRDPATAHLIRARTLPAAALLPSADRLEVVVQGACVGAGVEIAAFARRVVARPGAWFQLPEIAMGLVPGAGGCVSLPRRIGRRRAGLMILSGRRIDAATALRWGLIDAIEDGPPADEGEVHPHGGEVRPRRRPRPVDQA